jgi:RNA polymerase sigma factor (sigma-70 family)
MPDSDWELIQACRAGDAQGWERLLNQYERFVYSVCLKTGLTIDDAADVTQLTFTILLQSLDKLRSDTRLPPWLATVARRHAWRVLKTRRREAVDPELDLAENERLVGTTDSFEHWERLDWIHHGLEFLSDRCKSLIQALYLDPDEPSYEEIASRFGMALGSIGPTRARCLEQLKLELTRAAQV